MEDWNFCYSIKNKAERQESKDCVFYTGRSIMK